MYSQHMKRVSVGPVSGLHDSGLVNRPYADLTNAHNALCDIRPLKGESSAALKILRPYNLSISTIHSLFY